jgi:hypothetical protein
LEGKLFALLGVNCDPKKEDAKAAIAAERITWSNWHDGEAGEGSIASRYHIRAYPTTIVLDADGIARYKGVRDDELAGVVDVLLETMATTEDSRE